MEAIDGLDEPRCSGVGLDVTTIAIVEVQWSDEIVERPTGVKIDIDPDQPTFADGPKVRVRERDDLIMPVCVEQADAGPVAQRTKVSRTAANTARAAVVYWSTVMERSPN